MTASQGARPETRSEPKASDGLELGAHQLAALGALGFLVLVTLAWWALALWPAGPEPAAWLVRARAVCFDVGPSGLPDAAGWLLLVGQPLGMFAALMTISGSALRAGLRRVAESASGRTLLTVLSVLVVAGLSAAGVRVLNARSAPLGGIASGVPDSYPRLDRPAPALGLLDQHGDRIELERLRGRPALVTFAFAHCEAVCPALVRQVVAAQRALRASRGPAGAPRVVVVTLDPWRDTPARLPALASDYALGDDAFVLSGSVPEVNAALDRWNVPRGRDERTGMLTHAPLIYVLDGAGRIAYAATGGTAALVELLGRV